MLTLSTEVDKLGVQCDFNSKQNGRQYLFTVFVDVKGGSFL